MSNLSSKALKRILVLLLALALTAAGCGSLKSYSVMEPPVGSVKSVTVGSTMISVESGWTDTHNTMASSRFTQELIYGGLAQGVIRIAYREYSNDMARPAFSQEVQYDLAKSKVLTFRNLKLEILDADNTNIVYKVLEGPGENIKRSPGITITNNQNGSPSVNKIVTTSHGVTGITCRDREIEDVMSNSPAAAAGLKPGDILISVDGIALNGDADHDSMVLDGPIGTTSNFVIERDGRQFQMRIARVAPW